MATKTVDSVFKFIEGICYFALAGISILFVIGVLNQFLQKKTGFHQYEEPLTKSPTISFYFPHSLCIFLIFLLVDSHQI